MFCAYYIKNGHRHGVRFLYNLVSEVTLSLRIFKGIAHIFLG